MIAGSDAAGCQGWEIELSDILSPRQKQIWELHARGHGMRKIAAELGIARGSVQVQLKRIKEKLESLDSERGGCGGSGLPERTSAAGRVKIQVKREKVLDVLTPLQREVWTRYVECRQEA